MFEIIGAMVGIIGLTTATQMYYINHLHKDTTDKIKSLQVDARRGSKEHKKLWRAVNAIRS